MRLLHGVRTLFERLLEIVVVGLMLTLAVLVIVAVFLRYIGRPLFFYDEVASMLLAWVTYYGAALAAYRGAHIAFPGLVAAMPRPWRIAFVVFGKLVVIGFFVVLARLGFQVMQFLQGDALIMLRWFPLILAQHVIPVGAILFILAELLRTPEHIRFAIDPGRPEALH